MEVTMKLKKTIALILFLLLTGCMGKNIESDRMRGQINVFGVQLDSSVDYKEVNGVPATEESCLHGYDRNYDALDILIGYGFNKKIRKITTLNPNTSMFGIKPGMSFDEGKQRILQAGFAASTSPFKFNADGYSLTFLIDRNGKIFGLTLEARD